MVDEKTVLAQIKALILKNEINQTERTILLTAQQELEKQMYLPKVISNLKQGLTPFAIKRTLSESLKPFYLEITSIKYADKFEGLNIGWGMHYGKE